LSNTNPTTNGVNVGSPEE